MKDEIIIRSILDEYQQTKGEPFPVHIVARTAVVTRYMGRMTDAAFSIKYGKDKASLEELRKLAVQCGAAVIRLLENLDKE